MRVATSIAILALLSARAAFAQPDPSQPAPVGPVPQPSPPTPPAPTTPPSPTPTPTPPSPTPTTPTDPAPAPTPTPPAPVPANPADALRDGNTAASTGDWPRVSLIVEALLKNQLPPADLAEAHRLAGLAAFYQGRTGNAEHHFFEYLKIELDGRLDPALYPPDVVNFFEDVKQRHDAELRALRPKQRRYWYLNLLPPGGQIQNGDTAKAIVVGSALGVFAGAHFTTYFVLKRWCTKTIGPGGTSVTCDDPKDRSSSAATLRTVNIVSGIALIATYAYGVYDGMSGYVRRSRSVAPYVSPAEGGGVVGIGGFF